MGAKLASRGAGVVIFDLPNSDGAAVASELGGKVLFCPGDVTNPQDAQNAAEMAMKEFGSLQALVNCAGIGVAKRIYNVRKDQLHTVEEFQRVINVNLVGSFNMMTQAVKAMNSNPAEATLNLTDPANPDVDIVQRGVIINTASVAAFDGQIGQAAYSASKGGIVGLTLPAARDLAAVGIRVMCIAPGIYNTPMVAMMPEDVKAGLAADVVFPHRLGNPEEFGELVLSITNNPYLNGTTIRLDGAIRMPPRSYPIKQQSKM